MSLWQRPTFRYVCYGALFGALFPLSATALDIWMHKLAFAPSAAAAVQAGIAYNITDQIIWDNGWQMLWESNAIASSAPSASGENRIVYQDSILQQFRSGIRIKFD